MSAKTMILTGAAGLAAVVGFATPAAAQVYPGYPGYYGNNSGIVGAIINSVTGSYGRYPYGNYGYSQYGNQYGQQYGYNQNMVVDQCARAVEARLNGQNGYYGYGNVPYQGGYGYNGNAGGRVQGITRVDRKSYGLKVHGVASSGYNGYNGYGQRGYGNYGYSAGADLSFNCEVRNDGRIRDINISRRSANWRGY